MPVQDIVSTVRSDSNLITDVENGNERRSNLDPTMTKRKNGTKTVEGKVKYSKKEISY